MPPRAEAEGVPVSAGAAENGGRPGFLAEHVPDPRLAAIQIAMALLVFLATGFLIEVLCCLAR